MDFDVKRGSNFYSFSSRAKPRKASDCSRMTEDEMDQEVF